jgi:probable F420-dependent oxidoreductase
MKLGVVFPQLEIGNDPAVIRDFVQAVEGAGFDFLSIFDHVLGANRNRFAEGSTPPFTEPPYTIEDHFHEVFVLFGYLAGLTQRLELATGILILPQRQTALVAKQAAAVDVLTGGRLRLGVALGWNFTEYEALGEDFHTRGRRMSEQITVLRKLWTEPEVTFKGRWHDIDRMGIRPMPVQRPIPIWIGGGAEAVLKRVGRLADGWFPQLQPTDDAGAAIERVRGYMREAGRDPASLGIQAGGRASSGNPDEWVQRALTWRDLGATHLSAGTMGAGLTPRQHIEALLRWKAAVDAGLRRGSPQDGPS